MYILYFYTARIDYFPCILIRLSGTAAFGAPISISGRRAARTPASRVRAAPSAIRSRPCTRTPTPAITSAATPRPAPVRPRMVSYPRLRRLTLKTCALRNSRRPEATTDGSLVGRPLWLLGFLEIFASFLVYFLATLELESSTRFKSHCSRLWGLWGFWGFVCSSTSSSTCLN